MSDRLKGVLAVLGSGLCFGFLGIFGKAAFKQGLSAGELLSLRFLIASSTIGLGLLLTRPRSLWVGRTRLLQAMALGVLGYAIFSSCFFGALRDLSASLTVLLLYTYPVLVSLGGALFLKEHLRPAAWLALPGMILGLVFLVGLDFESHSSVGILLGFGSAFFYSIYILLSRKWLGGADLLPVVFWIQFSAGVVLCVLHFSSPGAVVAAFSQAPGPVLGAAWVGSVLAMTLFLLGLRYLRAAEASILSTAEPMTAIVAAHFILGESLGLWQIFGALLVLAALILTSWEATEK